MRASPRAAVTVPKHVNWAVALFAAVYCLLIPGATVVHDLTDPALRHEGIPRAAVRLHRSLTPKYERWARQRLAAGTGGVADTHDVSGTEWPLFGSVFYLWSTESLQEAWERDNSLSTRAPKEYARGAIEAAAELVIDPGHAAWVKKRWGEDYLHRENVFYRMLIIAALTAHNRLTGDARHLPMLRNQVESLAKELDESPHGLLDDYANPRECYPGDVLVAIACIRRADAVLGTDHSAFVARAERGFEGERLDRRGLPPYAADSKRGTAEGPSRGCGNSYMGLFAPEIWPETAAKWYALHEQHFWQHRWTAVGFREFPRDMTERDWYFDVDAGPVLAGHGFSACAFGLGAARVNGRYDHAYPLAAEMLVVSWPLPDGTLLTPRILSDATDAPYLGEAGILFTLTRQPAAGVAVTTGGRIPAFAYIVLALYFGVGAAVILSTMFDVRRWRRRPPTFTIPAPRLQSVLWLTLMLTAIITAAAGSHGAALLPLLGAQLLPRKRKCTAETDEAAAPENR